MIAKSFNAQNYRYGQGGQEKVNEIDQNHYTALFWEYDARLARRWNVDPKSNPSISSYNCFAGNPIYYSDILGDSVIKFSINESNYIHGEKDLYIDHTIIDDVKKIVDYAVENKVHIHINSTFRTNKRQQELNGDENAVTPAPAGSSTHNAGLAIDFNLYKDNDLTKGTISKNNTVTSGNEFISYVKGLTDWRWGGDWTTPDRVHIDKRGTDANFTALRDANQTQMNGSVNSNIDGSLVKREITYDPVLKVTTDNAIIKQEMQVTNRAREPWLNESQKNELRNLLRMILIRRR
jgi:hypothetical protein